MLTKLLVLALYGLSIPCIDADETILGKKAFKKFCFNHGVQVKHYHMDNGIFASNAWKESCQTSNQGLTFAGVNAHYQNDIAKRCMGELQRMARTMLLHAQHRWPQVVSTNLGPYALCMANEAPQCSS